MKCSLVLDDSYSLDSILKYKGNDSNLFLSLESTTIAHQNHLPVRTLPLCLSLFGIPVMCGRSRTWLQMRWESGSPGFDIYEDDQWHSLVLNYLVGELDLQHVWCSGLIYNFLLWPNQPVEFLWTEAPKLLWPGELEPTREPHPPFSEDVQKYGWCKGLTRTDGTICSNTNHYLTWTV